MPRGREKFTVECPGAGNFFVQIPGVSRGDGQGKNSTRHNHHLILLDCLIYFRTSKGAFEIEVEEL